MSAPVPAQVAAAADPSSGAQVLVAHRDRGGDQHQPGRGLVAALAVTQTVGYGVLYYAFAVVLAPLAADLGVSTTTITGALTLAVLVSAVGAILGAFALAAWSQVQTLAQLYLVFAGIGIASAMALYEATFALLVAVLDPWRRAKAILTVTIVAGFASSVFVPLTGVLVEEHGWRT